MSRIGKKPITDPQRASRSRCSTARVEVQGPKGKLRQAHPRRHQFRAGRRPCSVARRRPTIRSSAKFHGLARSLVANAVDRRHRRLQARARHRRRRLSRGVEGQAGDLRARLLARGRLRHPAGHRRDDRQADAHHRDRRRPAAGRPGRGQHPPAAASRIRYKQKGVRYTGEVLKKKAGKTGGEVGHEDQNQGRPARPHPAAAAQADLRRPRSGRA